MATAQLCGFCMRSVSAQGQLQMSDVHLDVACSSYNHVLVVVVCCGGSSAWRQGAFSRMLQVGIAHAHIPRSTVELCR